MMVTCQVDWHCSAVELEHRVIGLLIRVPGLLEQFTIIGRLSGVTYVGTQMGYFSSITETATYTAWAANVAAARQAREHRISPC